MKSRIVTAALAAMIAMPAAVALPSSANAQDYRRDDRDYRRDDRTYRGNDGRYQYHCKKSNGTTGLIAGGAGGALAGNLLGGGTLGTVAGGVGGALLGRHLDKRHDSAQNRRNGC